MLLLLFLYPTPLSFKSSDVKNVRFILCFKYFALYLHNKQKSNNRMSFTEHCNEIFNQAIRDYHVTYIVYTPINNPFD